MSNPSRQDPDRIPVGASQVPVIEGGWLEEERRIQDLFSDEDSNSGFPVRQLPGWVVELKEWCKRQGRKFPVGLKRKFSELERGTPADQTLPAVVMEISKLHERGESTRRRVLTVEQEQTASQVRLNIVDGRSEINEHAIGIARTENRELRVRLTAVERSAAAWRRHAPEADVKIMRMEREMEDLKRMTTAIKWSVDRGDEPAGVTKD